MAGYYAHPCSPARTRPHFLTPQEALQPPVRSANGKFSLQPLGIGLSLTTQAGRAGASVSPPFPPLGPELLPGTHFTFTSKDVTSRHVTSMDPAQTGPEPKAAWSRGPLPASHETGVREHLALPPEQSISLHIAVTRRRGGTKTKDVTNLSFSLS